MTCYLDLDGVLVDFDRGALAAHQLELSHDQLEWDWPTKVGLSPEEFWGKFDYEFWLGLHWTSEGKKILALVEEHFGDQVAVVTSPPKTPGATEGKLAWIKRHMPKYERKTFVGARKELLAAPNKLLIDDRDENIERFVLSGGLGFMIARPWNKARLREADILEDLESTLPLYSKLERLIK